MAYRSYQDKDYLIIVSKNKPRFTTIRKNMGITGGAQTKDYQHF